MGTITYWGSLKSRAEWQGHEKWLRKEAIIGSLLLRWCTGGISIGFSDSIYLRATLDCALFNRRLLIIAHHPHSGRLTACKSYQLLPFDHSFKITPERMDSHYGLHVISGRRHPGAAGTPDHSFVNVPLNLLSVPCILLASGGGAATGRHDEAIF